MSEGVAPTVDVLVVGAGPVGLMMAGEVARHGLSCRVVDENEGPSTTSKATVVHSRTLEVLEHVGALDEALARGRRVHANNVYAKDKRLLHVDLDELDAPHPMVLDLPQRDTEEILARVAASRGIEVERRKRVTAVAQDDGGVRATLDGKEQVRARWLVGCDGAESTVRDALRIAFEGAAHDEVWLAADVTLESVLADDELHAFLSPEGALVVFPLPAPAQAPGDAPPAVRARILWDHPGKAPGLAGAATPERAVPPPTLDDVQAALRTRTGMRGTVSDPRELVRFRVHRRIASSYGRGRVFLAGDAAHVHSPVGGQAMNLGIQDAYNLAWKLALVERGVARPSLIASYEAERRPIAAATVQGADLTSQLVTLRHPAARWARDRLAEVLSGVEVIQQRAVRAASQVAVGYRHSPVVGEHRGSLIAARLGLGGPEQPSFAEWLDFGAAPRPGDRAPDVRYDGERRLFDLLRGTHHTLLLFDGADATPAGYRALTSIADRAKRRLGAHVACHLIVPRTSRPADLAWDGSVVLDRDGTLHKRYGASSECLYLVRPDGHVGFRSQPADAAAFDAFLSRVFG